MYHVRNDYAAVAVMTLSESGEYVWPVFVNHPYLIDPKFLAEREEWKGAKSLAQYIFKSLDALSRYELLLVHDLEEYVDSNFEFDEMRDMRPYRGG